MKYVLLVVFAAFIFACQSAKQMVSTDYSLLNGVWDGDCSLIVTGQYKGGMECPIMETHSLTTIWLNERHEGIWVFQRDDNRPDTTKMRLIMRDKRAILQMEQGGEQSEREVVSVTQDSLKVYTSSRENVALFRRKK
jgi:hypothetical protein